MINGGKKRRSTSGRTTDDIWRVAENEYSDLVAVATAPDMRVEWILFGRQIGLLLVKWVFEAKHLTPYWHYLCALSMLQALKACRRFRSCLDRICITATRRYVVDSFDAILQKLLTCTYSVLRMLSSAPHYRCFLQGQSPKSQIHHFRLVDRSLSLLPP